MPKENTIITIVVKGGVIQEILNIPSSTTIQVKDYDIDGADQDDLQQDENGDRFVESLWFK